MRCIDAYFLAEWLDLFYIPCLSHFTTVRLRNVTSLAINALLPESLSTRWRIFVATSFSRLSLLYDTSCRTALAWDVRLIGLPNAL
jgi:hypothetical protein